MALSTLVPPSPRMVDEGHARRPSPGGVIDVTGRAAVFLDRDGVLLRTPIRNGTPHPPETVADVELLPGVVDGCRALRAAGFPLVVVSNQPDVARGTATAASVTAI